MSTTERIRRQRHPLRFRELEAVRVSRLTPGMVRVVFGGDDLKDFVSLGFDDHIKLMFPEPGQDRPALPEMVDGRASFPDGVRPPMRDYTPRAWDPDAGELTIDFVVHGEGPASAWASRAKPGDVIGGGGPRGSKIPDDDFGWHLLVGDAAALPAIGRRLEELPAGTKATAVIEVADAAEEQNLRTDADAEVVWLHRGGAAPGTTGNLERAVRELDFPDSDDIYVFLGGEATTLRPIRRHLVDERGVRREHLNASGYWKRATAAHDHHEPLD